MKSIKTNKTIKKKKKTKKKKKKKKKKIKKQKTKKKKIKKKKKKKKIKMQNGEGIPRRRSASVNPLGAFSRFPSSGPCKPSWHQRPTFPSCRLLFSHTFLHRLFAGCAGRLLLMRRRSGRRLVLSVVGDSVAGLDVVSRCEGLDAELGDVSEGIVWLCAITSPTGAMEINAATKSVCRGVMDLS